MARPTKKEIWKQRIAYGVTKMTEETIGKLAQAFAIGATGKQACDYADIDPSTLWQWEKDNPELSKYFDRMREKLPLKSKQNIALAIHGTPGQGDLNLSKWLIERQEPEDYAETLKIKGLLDISKEEQEILDEFHDKLKKNIKERSRQKAKEDGEL